MSQPKAVVLFSGGLDSTTCLAYAKEQGYDLYALSFDYGQKHVVELEAAKRIARASHVTDHQILSLPTLTLGGSALTSDNITVPDATDSQDIPSTYVPARNTLFLSYGLGWAEQLKADALFIGVSAIDYSGYPDCRPTYIKAYQAMAKLAATHSVTIETPLIHLSKAETIALGIRLGVDYSQTISCYRATAARPACGTCDSCVIRQQAFEAYETM